MSFAIQAVPGGAHVVLAVCGDVDIATAPQLRDRLGQAVAAYPSVVVDLADVGFMDSTGLGVLVASSNRAKAAGRRLVVARPQTIVRNALRLVQVDSVIDVYETLDDAVAAV
jgi:anti-sigma B factor antagonist